MKLDFVNQKSKSKIVVFSNEYCLAALLFFAIAYGAALRIEVFFEKRLTYEHITYYLLALGQSETGRLMTYGPQSGRFELPLGPLVLYIWSLFLHVWPSILCLLALSLAVSFASITMAFFYLKNRLGIVPGLFAAAFISASMPPILEIGEIQASMLLTVSALAWMFLFFKGLETRKGWVYTASFIFLSIALHSNMEGFLLIPTAVCIYFYMGGRIKAGWFFAGIYIVLASYYLYIETEFTNGFTIFRNLPHTVGPFLGMGLKNVGTDANDTAHLFTYYFRTLGVVPGAAMAAALAYSLFFLYRNAGRRKASKEAAILLPWAMLQLWGFIGLLAANRYSRYYLLYLIGAAGTTTFVFKLVAGSRAKIVLLPASALLLFFMLGYPQIRHETLKPSRYAAVSAVKNMEKYIISQAPNACEVTSNFHTLINHNMLPGLINIAPVSTYLFLDTKPGCEVRSQKSSLFLFKDRFDSKLDAMIRERFPEIDKGEMVVSYDSRIDQKSWMYCPGGIDQRADGSWLNDPSCKKFNRAFRNSYENQIHTMYPELEKDSSDRSLPDFRIDETYSFYVRLQGAPSETPRLIIVQTIGCAGEYLLSSGQLRKAKGRDISYMSLEDKVVYTCSTWHIVPSGEGWLGFDWHYQRNPATERDFYPNLYIDVIDIDMPNVGAGLIEPAIAGPN